MCPTILLCLIILSLMSVWYKVQILDIDDSTCLIWNHARYSVPGYELENKNGLQCTRHNCNVRGCNASIYITWNDSVPQFRGKSDHDEWNNIKHSIHGHSDWGGAALIRESAITSINMDISIGKSKSDAFHSYSLSHLTSKAVTDVPRKYLNDIKRMATEYLEPIWINHEARFARCEWNEYRREIRANNHAESMNNAVQKFLGVHPEFYLWLWKSKQFSATQLARWRRYHENGFQRKRKVKEHLKNLNLKDLWDKVALPVNEGGISLYTYMRGVSLVYREKWSELNAMFGPLNYDNDKM
eukprot:515314_1